MPDDVTHSPSLNDQLRWQRELDISRSLPQQRSPGFFPGPGAEADDRTAMQGGGTTPLGRAGKGSSAEFAGKNVSKASGFDEQTRANDASMGRLKGMTESLKKKTGGGAGMPGNVPGASPGGMPGGMPSAGGSMPGGGAGAAPGGKLMEAYGKGGDKTEQALRMGGAAAAEGAGAVGKAFGPEGELAGQAASQAISGVTEGAIAAKNILQGGGLQSAANLLKQQLDQTVWPHAAMFPDMVIAIPVLQFYWVCSIAHFSWTVPMKVWEHVVMGFITMFEIAIVILIISAVGMIVCMYNATTCGVQVFGNLVSSIIPGLL